MRSDSSLRLSCGRRLATLPWLLLLRRSFHLRDDFPLLVGWRTVLVVRVVRIVFALGALRARFFVSGQVLSLEVTVVTRPLLNGTSAVNSHHEVDERGRDTKYTDM